MRISILIGSLMMAAFMMSGCANKFEYSLKAAQDYLDTAKSDILKETSDPEERKKNCRSAKEKAKEARKAIREASRAKPDHVDSSLLYEAIEEIDCRAYFFEGLAEYIIEEYREAAYSFSIVLRSSRCRQEKEPAYLHQALSRHNLNEYKEAIPGYEWLIANGRKQDNIDAAFENLGKCHYGLGNYKAALDHYEAYYRKYPASPKAASLLCEAKFVASNNGQSSEKRQDILSFCKKAQAQDPNNKIVQTVLSNMSGEKKSGGKKSFEEKLNEFFQQGPSY